MHWGSSWRTPPSWTSSAAWDSSRRWRRLSGTLPTHTTHTFHDAHMGKKTEDMRTHLFCTTADMVWLIDFPVTLPLSGFWVDAASLPPGDQEYFLSATAEPTRTTRNAIARSRRQVQLDKYPCTLIQSQGHLLWLTFWPIYQWILFFFFTHVPKLNRTKVSALTSITTISQIHCCLN